MIIRRYIRCKLCDQHHTLRIQLGIQPIQSHEFQCLSCAEPISLAFSIRENGAKEHVNDINGAHVTDDPSSTSTKFRYLSSDFAADEENITDPMYFGAMKFLNQVFSSPAGKAALQESSVGPQIRQIYTARKPQDIWATIQRCWRLQNAGRYDLSTRLLSDLAREEGWDTTEFRAALKKFLTMAFGVNIRLTAEAQKALHANPGEFRRLLVAFENEWKPMWRQDQYDVIKSYFDQHGDHSQVYQYIRMEIDIPEGHIVTSNNFPRTRSFYAHAFELHAKQIVLLAAINNIICGRPFDELQNISLSRYSTNDASTRRDTFLHNDAFRMATREYESSLRNAISHNWIAVSLDGTTLSIQKPGQQQVKKMSYTEYLWRCGNLMKQICQLMNLEIQLDDLSRHFACIVKEPNLPST